MSTWRRARSRAQARKRSANRRANRAAPRDSGRGLADSRKRAAAVVIPPKEPAP